MNIPLALRLVACGLPVPTFTPGKDGGCASWITSGKGDDSRHWEVELATGDTCRPFGTDPAAGLLFRCVTTDDGPRLLPVLDGFALSGWIKAEISKLVGGFVGSFPYYSKTSQGWHVVVDGPDMPDGPIESAILNCGPEATEIEALTAAWEAALKAAE